MILFFDWKCPECGGIFEGVVRHYDETLDKCKLCGYEGALEKQLAAPRWIEGTTPGSKPPSRGVKHKIDTVEDLYK